MVYLNIFSMGSELRVKQCYLAYDIYIYIYIM